MTDHMTTLGEIVDIYDGPHATPKKTEKGPYFLSISSLDSGRLDLSKSAHLDDSSFKKWTKRVTPQGGDLLFSYETRLGEAALMPKGVKACLGRRMGLLRPKPDKVIPEYLLYEYLSPYFQQIISRNTIVGATVNRISLNEMPDFPVRIPPILEQEAISSLLMYIDRKIEVNNKVNAELESMAKLIYDYWFVQFDFPDASGKPYKSSGGKMVYNEPLKCEVPDGWKAQPLVDCCNVVDCLHSKKPDFKYNAENYYLMQLDNILNNGQVNLKKKYYVSKHDYENWTSRIEVREHDVVMTNAGRVAAFAQVPNNIACGIGRNITAIRPEKISPNYFYISLSGLHMQKQILSNLDQGAFFKSFNVKGIKLLQLLRPSNEIEGSFENLITPLIEKRQLALAESNRLEELRDWLLPMLMNGQATFRDA